MEKLNHTSAAAEESPFDSDEYVIDDLDILDGINDNEKRGDALAELEAMHGGRVFHYGSYSGTVTDMYNSCPAFGEVLERGTGAASAWLESRDEPQTMKETEKIEEESPSTAEEQESRAEEKSAPIIQTESKETAKAPAPAVEQEVQQATNKAVEAVPNVDTKSLDDFKVAQENVAASNQNQSVEAAPEAVRAEPSSTESVADISTSKEVIQAAAPPQAVEHSAGVTSDSEGTADTTKPKPELVAMAVVSPLIRDEINEPRIEVSEPTASSKIEAPEKQMGTEKGSGGVNQEALLSDVPIIVSDNPTPNIPLTLQRDTPSYDRLEESGVAEAEELPNVESLQRAENSDLSEEYADYDTSIPELDDSTEPLESAVVSDEMDEEIVTIAENWHEEDEATTVLHKALENEQADTEVVPSVEQEVSDMVSELIGEPPEIKNNYNPMKAYLQASTVIKKIELLENARTAEECHDALQAVREELAGMLFLLGYDNADEIVELLTKRYDVQTLKKFIVSLMRIMTSAERSATRHQLTPIVLPSHHKCGSSVVRMVVSLIEPMHEHRAA